MELPCPVCGVTGGLLQGLLPRLAFEDPILVKGQEIWLPFAESFSCQGDSRLVWSEQGQ